MDATTTNARTPRTSVMLSARITAPGVDAQAPHRVLNLSETGIGIAVARPLAVGSTVGVSIGEIEGAPATVMWSRATAAGLRFETEIDIAAARRRRPAGTAAVIGTGWMTDINHAYRRGR